ncbi:hypothetical protein OOK29_22585 [Streptomyces phaeochromogenes]|uniref:hypothetical protein n=1 Tax=Streptomyces TaxID=1883 RepID=UPI00224EDCA8|nr:hypothetical protein [Streptomyces phaeochromogenes]MCX5600946.1 hypothetical protein [Streptomyces phaeochromogenes]
MARNPTASGARSTSTAQQPERLVHHETAGDTADERASAAEADRSQNPERDLEDDVHQRQRDQHVDQTVVVEPEQAAGAEPARGQEHSHSRDQGQGLHDLDGEHAAEGFPPPAGDAVGLRQGVADQRQGRGDDQNDRQGHTDDEGQQQGDQDPDGYEPHQDEEDAPAVGIEGVEHEVP